MPEQVQDRPRVLVIDDNMVTRRLLQLHLNALGFDWTLAESGEQGLEMAAAGKPDAILLDIQLPGIDGLTVCRRLREEKTTSDIPILMVTSLDDVSTRIAGFEAGADDYVTKPFESRELGARLRANINMVRQRRQAAALEGVLSTLLMLAHEFNNPLQTVLGGLQMATDAEENDLHRVEGLQMAREGVEELAELARRLQRLSQPVFTPTPLGEMLDVHASTS